MLPTEAIKTRVPSIQSRVRFLNLLTILPPANCQRVRICRSPGRALGTNAPREIYGICCLRYGIYGSFNAFGAILSLERRVVYGPTNDVSSSVRRRHLEGEPEQPQRHGPVAGAPGLLADLTRTQHDPFEGGQFDQTHRPARPDAVGADADLGAQAELSAGYQPGRGLHQHRCAGHRG